MCLPDMSHRSWHDAQLALSDCGLHKLALMTIAFCSCDSGPWPCERWFLSAQEAALQFVKVADTQDPLWKRFEQSILEEQALDNFDLTQADPSTALQNIPKAFEKKNEKVGLSRWFQLIISLRMLMPKRFTRLLVTTYLCLQTGAFKKGQGADALLKVPDCKHASPDVPKSSTGIDTEEVRKVRNQFTNSLAFCAACLGDSAIWDQLQVINLAMEPLQHWHSAPHKHNRSRSESLLFWQSFAEGMELNHVNATLQLLRSNNACRALKIRVARGLHPEGIGGRRSICFAPR